jgi:TolB protein
MAFTLNSSSSDVPGHPRVLIIRAIAGILAAGALLALWVSDRWWQATPRGEVVQLTRDRGFEGLPSLSPDGERLAYRGDATGAGDIYVRALGSVEALNLTNSPADDETDPAFSPDGRLVAYSTADRGIFVVGADGNGPRRLTQSGFNPAWTPDGNSIIYASPTFSGDDVRLTVSEGMKVEVATGMATRVTSGDFREPAVSPNGLRIAYWSRPVDLSIRRRVRSTRGDIWTIGIDGRDPRQVTSDSVSQSSPVWSRDGRFLYYVSSRNGFSGIWRVPIDERTGRTRGVAMPVRTPGSEPVHITQSADGRRFAWSTLEPIREVLRVGFDSDARTTRGQPAEAIRRAAAWSTAELSPDGSTLLLTVLHGQSDLYAATAGGAELRRLTNDPATDTSPRWSPDGRRIAFQSDREGRTTVWIINADGSGLRRLANASGQLLHPVWSPDGDQIIVWDTDLQGSRIFRVSAEPASAPLETLPPMPQGTFLANDWSQDGTLVAGTGSGAVWIYSIETRSYERIRPGGNPVWLNDSRRLIYAYAGRLFIAEAVWKITRDLLALPGQELDAPRLSRDNLQLYFSRGGMDANLWFMTVK